MTDLSEPHEEWSRWVEQACERLGVDAQEVDISGIHDLSRLVAHNVDRPLAPVSTYILGMAVGAAVQRGETVTAAERDAMIALFPIED